MKTIRGELKSITATSIRPYITPLYKRLGTNKDFFYKETTKAEKQKPKKFLRESVVESVVTIICAL